MKIIKRGKMSYLSNLKKLYFHPSHFFSSVEKDRDYSKIMFFYVKIIILSSILTLLSSAILLTIKKSFTAQGFISLIFDSVISIGLAFLVPFVMAGIIHLGVLIFRGKQGYYNTYKPVAYSLVIVAVYSIISTVLTSILSIIYPTSQLPSMTADSTAYFQTLLQDSNFVLLLAVAFTILVISFIHSLIVQVVGISKFQKISKLKSFLSVIIVSIIIIILTIIVMSIVATYFPVSSV